MTTLFFEKRSVLDILYTLENLIGFQAEPIKNFKFQYLKVDCYLIVIVFQNYITPLKTLSVKK